ncbi:SMP-30/gluconolactonase/LRE family protein [Sphingomonas sp.]|uniref:SMP-30/gluconolactonase/LRE family protein n=1 Tax=Sphingomonas sp. TaxID=28214 RepID=UPI003B3AAB9D
MLKAFWLAALLGTTVAHAQQAPRTIANVGFVGSECVRYDAAADRYLVSNLNGDQPGFISIVTPDGAVETLKWIDGTASGLSDPLGLFIAGEKVYVADPGMIRIYDRLTGKAAGGIAVPGAQRLNDLAVAKDGTIYVTDSARSDQPGALFRISPSGQVSEWVARNDTLEKPNGIAVMPDGTIVHGGRGVNLVFRDPSGRILRERSLPLGRIDGIVALADGGLLVASQDGHAVYHVAVNDGPITQVARDIEVPAAIGHDPKRNRLIVPQIRAASLTFVDLPGS